MPKKSQINEYSTNCVFGLPLQVTYFPHTDAREAAYQYFKKVVGVHKIEKTAGVLSFSQFAHPLQSICILQYSPISVWFFPCSYICHCLQMAKMSQINEYSDGYGCWFFLNWYTRKLCQIMHLHFCKLGSWFVAFKILALQVEVDAMNVCKGSEPSE